MIEIGQSLITVWGLSHLFGHMESLATGWHRLYNAQAQTQLFWEQKQGGTSVFSPLKHGRRKEGEGPLTFLS